MSREQLKKLAAPIPKSLQSETGRSGLTAADHTVTVQWLLASVGPYDFEIVEKLYSKPKRGEDPILNGVVCRLTCEIDGRTVRVEEAGGVENALNQDGDGERLKHALSDAIKRCAMRLGVGLNIWSGNHYFLHTALEREEKGQAGPQAVTTAAEGATPTAPPTDSSRAVTGDSTGGSEDSDGTSQPAPPQREKQLSRKEVLRLIELIEKCERSQEKFRDAVLDGAPIDEYVPREVYDKFVPILEAEAKKKAAS